ncbi:hypothetical protein Val02_81720 [Virgisporangium aliadipatigenens]|uniref:HTH cro/C1-type domain-containing protein n=1 Tax=Virgisporangium aliadipatigenens TaxID=741659 RepID=A0A8J3YTK2_9ACTN|nr:helix-turn-helix transcriptional regulator [Virgisporangium aliadipatigenens]GIJ51286.1 hypothetical protein Val02_81720 [Virgisporangium aliadipatigenens]
MPDTNKRRQAARSVLDHDPAVLRARRVALGLTQVAVATAAGCVPSHLAELERGTRNPSPPLLKRIADALGCEVRDLMPARETVSIAS